MSSESSTGPIQKLCRVGRGIEKAVMVFLPLVFGLLIIYEIVIRALGFRGISWLEECSRYMLVITTYLGCSMATTDGGHMIMDLLYTKFPPRAAHLLRAIVHLLCGGCLFYLSYYAWVWTAQVRRIGTTAATFRMPMFLVWIPITIAFFTWACRYIIMVRRSLKEFMKAETQYEIQTDKEM